MKTDLLNYYSDGKAHSNEDMRKYFKATPDSEKYHQLRAAQQMLKREQKYYPVTRLRHISISE